MSDLGQAVDQAVSEVIGGEPQPSTPEVDQPQGKEKIPENYEIRLKKAQDKAKALAEENAYLMGALSQKGQAGLSKEEEEKRVALEEAISKMTPSEKLIWENQQRILKELDNKKPDKTASQVKSDQETFFSENPSLDIEDVTIQFKKFFRTRPELVPLFQNGKLSFNEVYSLSGGDNSLLGGGSLPVPNKTNGSSAPPGSVGSASKGTEWNDINNKIANEPSAGLDEAFEYMLKDFGRN